MVMLSLGIVDESKHFTTMINDGEDTRRVATVPLDRGRRSERSVLVVLNDIHSIDHPGFPRIQELLMQGVFVDLAQSRVVASRLSVAHCVMKYEETWRSIIGPFGPYIGPPRREGGSYSRLIRDVTPEMLQIPRRHKSEVVFAQRSHVLASSLADMFGAMTAADELDTPINARHVHSAYGKL